jgi:hypothetical protein
MEPRIFPAMRIFPAVFPFSKRIFPPCMNFTDIFPNTTLQYIPGKLPSLLTEEFPAYLMGKNAVGVSKNVPVTTEATILRKQGHFPTERGLSLCVSVMGGGLAVRYENFTGQKIFLTALPTQPPPPCMILSPSHIGLSPSTPTPLFFSLSNSAPTLLPLPLPTFPPSPSRTY